MQLPIRNALLSIPDACNATRLPRSAFYAAASRGLMVRPVKVGPRSAAVPAAEIDAINAARIAGKSDEEVKALVQRLHAARSASA